MKILINMDTLVTAVNYEVVSFNMVLLAGSEKRSSLYHMVHSSSIYMCHSHTCTYMYDPNTTIYSYLYMSIACERTPLEDVMCIPLFTISD